jgi:two-component system chemotaxis response regulator CheY
MGAKNILAAENVAQGKKYLSEFPITFIISDWNMPGESGFDFLKYVRADPKFKQLPFILLTTVGEEDSVLDAVMNGASNYLLKPWTSADLGEKMKAAYKKHNPGKVLF